MIEGANWEGGFDATFDEKKIKIEGFDFSYNMSEGDECGETRLLYSCQHCEGKGSISFWGGGQARIGYNIQ